MTNNLHLLKNIVKNKTVIIMLHGKSIEQLENHIEQLKDKDICYASLNYFDLMEDYILNKINKRLDYVLDTAGVKDNNKHNYSIKRRIPRLKKLFSRPDKSMLLTIHGVMKNLIEKENCGELLEKNKDRILVLDSLGIDLINVPNSASLLISVTLLAGAKKIIICGMDGYLGKPENSVPTYYKQDLYLQHQKDALGTNDITHLNGDTKNFEIMIKNIISSYCQLLEIKQPEIYNCSPNSLINVFPKIDYNQLKDIV